MHLVFLKAQCRSLNIKSLRIRRYSSVSCTPASFRRPSPWLHYQRREARTKATVTVRDLPLGSAQNDLTAQEETDDSPLYPTVIQQAWNNMRKFENCVLLTRMGGFYEVSGLPINFMDLAYVVLALLRTRRRICTTVKSQGGSEENNRRTSCYGGSVVNPDAELSTDIQGRPGFRSSNLIVF